MFEWHKKNRKEIEMASERSRWIESGIELSLNGIELSLNGIEMDGLEFGIEIEIGIGLESAAIGDDFSRGFDYYLDAVDIFRHDTNFNQVLGGVQVEMFSK